MRLLTAVVLFLGLHAQAADERAIAATTAEELKGFHNESEIGYIVVGGNTKSESFSGKTAATYGWEKDILKLSGHYLSSKAKNQQTGVKEGTAENWSAIGRYERILVPELYATFVQAGYSGDRFIGVDLGQAYDIGAKRFWISSDKLKFFSELGYRYLHEDFKENPVTGQESYKESHFIRLYSQIDYTHTDSIKFGLWAEYLPDMKDNENYRINFSPYTLVLLNDTFSLKFGYEGYYRSQPVAPNTIRLDYRHVTALIAKF